MKITELDKILEEKPGEREEIDDILRDYYKLFSTSKSKKIQDLADWINKKYGTTYSDNLMSKRYFAIMSRDKANAGRRQTSEEV